MSRPWFRASAGAALLAIAGAALAGGTAPDAFEPDGTIPEAKFLYSDITPQPRTFHVGPDRDVVRFYAVVGEATEIDLEIGADLRQAAQAVLPDQVCKILIEVFDSDGNPVRVDDGLPYTVENFCDLDTPGPEISLALELGQSARYPEGRYFARVRMLDAAEAGDPAFVQFPGSYELGRTACGACGSGRVQGVVTATGGAPLEGVTITARRVPGKQKSGQSGETLADGSYSFVLSVGTYEFRYFAEGYQPSEWIQSGTLTGDDTLTRNVTLVPILVPGTPDIEDPELVGDPLADTVYVQATVNTNGSATTATFAAVPLDGGNGASVTDTVTTAEQIGFGALTGLSPCSTYRIDVSATSASGSDPADTPSESRTVQTFCQPPPVINSFGATPTATSAQLTANVSTMNAQTFVKFQYKRAIDPSYTDTIEQSAGPSPDPTIVNRLVTSLSCGTLYDFRVSARHTSAPVVSSVMQFTTNACANAPVISQLAANMIQRRSATVSGRVQTNGQAVTATIDYRVVGAPTYTSAGNFNLADQPTSQLVMTTVGGLTCGTNHEFRVSATGGATSQTSPFTTSACILPQITGTTVLSTNVDRIQFQANVTTNGSPYTLVFEYRVQGSGGAYAQTPTVQGGPAPGTQVVSETAFGLECGTTYEYRVVASNEDGTAVAVNGTSTATASCGDVLFRSDFE